MRTFKIMVVIMTAAICSYAAAQRPRMESFPEGSYSPVTNINRNSYPRVLADGSVMSRVHEPQAQNVQLDLGGTKYDNTKREHGA